MVVRGGGAVSYERGTPVRHCSCFREPAPHKLQAAKRLRDACRRVQGYLDVPLYVESSQPAVWGVPGMECAVQGYLAHKKTPIQLGQPYDPRHSPTVGS